MIMNKETEKSETIIPITDLKPGHKSSELYVLAIAALIIIAKQFGIGEVDIQHANDAVHAIARGYQGNNIEVIIGGLAGLYVSGRTILKGLRK